MARKMNQEERWNQFALSGKVMDYLEYRRDISEGQNSTAERSKEHEGNSYTYRDGINSISHERIR